MALLELEPHARMDPQAIVASVDPNRDKAGVGDPVRHGGSALEDKEELLSPLRTSTAVDAAHRFKLTWCSGTGQRLRKAF